MIYVLILHLIYFAIISFVTHCNAVRPIGVVLCFQFLGIIPTENTKYLFKLYFLRYCMNVQCPLLNNYNLTTGAWHNR